MKRKLSATACIASFVLAVVATASSAEAPTEMALAAASKKVQMQCREDKQQQVRSGNPPADPGREMKGNQGREITPGGSSDARQGPYGDKQKAKKMSGKSAAITPWPQI